MRTDIDITFGNLVKVYFENRSARIEKTTLADKRAYDSDKDSAVF